MATMIENVEARRKTMKILAVTPSWSALTYPYPYPSSSSSSTVLPWSRPVHSIQRLEQRGVQDWTRHCCHYCRRIQCGFQQFPESPLECCCSSQALRYCHVAVVVAGFGGWSTRATTTCYWESEWEPLEVVVADEAVPLEGLSM